MAPAPRNPSPRVRHIVGCMTGTSLDGLDCALVRITGEGLDMTAEFLGLHSQPFDDALRAQLLHLAEGHPAPPIEYLRAARMLGVMHAQAVETLLRTHGFLPLAPGSARGQLPAPMTPTDANQSPRAKPGANGAKTIDFLVAHGQTIHHAPQDTLSWQLFDPWPIVRHLGVPVCYDLRQADLIAGGEGAPITPIADRILYPEPYDMVVNLGGIMNITLWTGVLDQGEIEACDVCPCNLLIDGLVQRLFPGKKYDEDGRIAQRGRPSAKALDVLGSTFEIHGAGEGSLGRENCTSAQLESVTSKLGDVPPEDVIYSAVAFVVNAIVEYSEAMVPEGIVLAGGGARHPLFLELCKEAIAEYETDRIVLSDDLGIPCEAREAMAFAVLGALSQDGAPITLPQVTGADQPGVAGVWVYP